MISLLGFKHYDGEPHEFCLTEADAQRVGLLVGMQTRTNAVCYVTIYPRGIDNGDPQGYINGAGGAIPDTSELGTGYQRQLFPTEDGR